MNTILLSASDQMQNIYTPLPLKMHIGFCIIATIVYILEIYRKRSVHYVFLMLAVDATLLMQAFSTSTMVKILAVLEVLFLGAAAVFAYLGYKKKKLARQQAETQTETVQEESTMTGDTDEDSDT